MQEIPQTDPRDLLSGQPEEIREAARGDEEFSEGYGETAHEEWFTWRGHARELFGVHESHREGLSLERIESQSFSDDI